MGRQPASQPNSAPWLIRCGSEATANALAAAASAPSRSVRQMMEAAERRQEEDGDDVSEPGCASDGEVYDDSAPPSEKPSSDDSMGEKRSTTLPQMPKKPHATYVARLVLELYYIRGTEIDRPKNFPMSCSLHRHRPQANVGCGMGPKTAAAAVSPFTPTQPARKNLAAGDRKCTPFRPHPTAALDTPCAIGLYPLDRRPHIPDPRGRPAGSAPPPDARSSTIDRAPLPFSRAARLWG